MYLKDPLFEPVDDHVVVWIGDLTPDELDAFLNEPGGCGYDEPHSEFMRDLGRWCDHDFLWAHALPAPGSIDDIISANGIRDESLIQQLRTRSDVAGGVQAFIALWNARLVDSAARSRDIHGGRLKCLDSWKQESPLTDGY